MKIAGCMCLDKGIRNSLTVSMPAISIQSARPGFVTTTSPESSCASSNCIVLGKLSEDLDQRAAGAMCFVTCTD